MDKYWLRTLSQSYILVEFVMDNCVFGNILMLPQHGHYPKQITKK